MSRPLYRHAELHRLIHPSSIAIVGASNRPGAFGQRVFENLADYQGALYPVNQRYQEVAGHRCYPSLADLPIQPDLVILAVPRDEVEPMVEECARVGAGGIIVYASGFAEMGRPQYIELQQRIVARARSAGIPLVGPNNIGIVNWGLGAVCTFLTPMPARPSAAPPIGLVSQSGALGFALGQANEHGTAFSHVLTCGNSADVDVADYVAYLAHEPSCKAIACLFEGMSEPMRMVEACELARLAGKAVVVFKIATGIQGAEAAMSHTGSLAGSNDAYAAAFGKAGAMLVDNYEELLETAAFFAKAGLCEAPGVAVLSTSGGAAIMAADKAEVHQVPLPQPAAATTAVLLELIPEFGSARNPCDVTAQVVSDPIPFRKSAGALIEDPAYGALVVPVVYAYDVLKPRIELLSDLARQTGKPVCIVWLPMWIEGPGAHGADSNDNVAMFRSMDTCFATLARWRKWSDMQREKRVTFMASTSQNVRAKAHGLLTSMAGDVLSERPAKALLASYGVPMVTDVLVRSADAAVEAARLRYPVVLKADSARIPHKTEAGVVRLNIQDESALRIAYAEIMANALKVAPLEDINGVLVQQMIPKGLEMIVGARIDPMFGPLIVVGLGGILVELVKDSAVALAPVSAREASRLLEGLKGYRLLQGFRGSAPVDVDQLARIVSLVSEFAFDFRDQISELDINPLICTGDRIIGVDALIARKTRPLPPASSPEDGATA